MRPARILRFIGIAAVLAAAAGSGAWWLGSTRIPDRLAQIKEQADERGWTATYEISSISGFPFGYDVQLEGIALIRPETGMLVRVPSATLRWAGRIRGDVVIELPESFQIDIPNSEGARARDPQLPPFFQLVGRSSGAGARISIAEDGVARIAAEATEIALTLDQPDYPITATASVAQISGDWMGDEEVSVTAMEARLGGGTREGSEPMATFGLAVGAVDADIAADAAARDALSEVAYAGTPGRAKLTYRFETAEGRFELRGDRDGRDGTLAFTNGQGGATVAVDSGRIEVDAEAQSVQWVLTRPDELGPGGSATAARTSLSYVAPLAPTDAVTPGLLRLGLEEVTGGDDLWSWLDPDERLRRDPANLLVDFGFTTRLLSRIDHLSPGEQPAYEVANVMVNEAVIGALGAEASATGDFEVLQPALIPEGTLQIRAEGVEQLMSALEGAGLIDASVRETGAAILQVYAQPAGDDAWQTELRVGPDGLSINGLPVQ